MNLRQINLVLLAIVIGLLGTIGFMLYWMKDRPRFLTHPARIRVVENTVTQLAVLKFNPTNLLDELTKLQIGWSAIESTNYFLYRNNLRSFGCPEETVRDILLTDIAKMYNRRQNDLLAQAVPFDYWRTVREGEEDVLTPELREAIEALKTERNGLVRTLLKVDFESEFAKYLGAPPVQQRLLGFLNPEKRGLVLDIVNSFAALEREIYQRSGGILLPSDERQLRDLEQQRQEELTKILSPEELTAYELTASPLASELRHELFGFEPTEGEFQSVYNLRKSFNQVLASTLEDSSLDPEVRERAIQDAEAALDGELSKILGEERFAEYERVRDPDFQFLMKWTERMQMPSEMASQVYKMKQQAQQQRERIESNLQLTYEQRQLAYQAITRETENSLSGLLGAENFQEYRQSGGQWIREIGQSDGAFEILLPEVNKVLTNESP